MAMLGLAMVRLGRPGYFGRVLVLVLPGAPPWVPPPVPTHLYTHTYPGYQPEHRLVHRRGVTG